MTKTVCILLLIGFLGSGASGAQDSSSSAQLAISDALTNSASSHDQDSCKRGNAAEVVVCGRSQQRYRIDPSVLAAARAAEAPPPKPPITAESTQPCSGQECGGGTIPLVGMALTALKAAELAARGDDWRDAFRTHPDQYQAYRQTKDKEATSRGISLGVSVGNR